MFNFNFKTITILLFCMFASVLKHINIEDKEISPSQIKLCEKGGKTYLNDQEISFDFFGHDNMPNEDDIWEKEETNEITTLKFVNNNGIIFIQNWNFQDRLQPTLELIIQHPEKKLNIKYEMVIKNTKPNDYTKIHTNLNAKTNKLAKSIDCQSIMNQDGWIAIDNEDNIFALLVKHNKVEITPDMLKIHGECKNQNQINAKFELHSSAKQYCVLKNQDKFKDLENSVDLGFFLYHVSQPIFILSKLLHDKCSIIVILLILVFLFGLLFLPFSIDSIVMQKKLVQMQPELDAINKLDIPFLQKNQFLNEIHQRYGYHQMTHLGSQMLLIIALTVFQSVLGCLEFSNVLPNSQVISYFVILILCVTMMIYNKVLFNNNQPFFTCLFALFFMNSPKLPLICFILLHWFNILLLFIYNLRNHE